MRRTEEETAEIHYKNGVVSIVPKRLCDQVVLRAQLPERLYTTYKEGCILFCLSERRFYDLVKLAQAKVKFGGRTLISVKKVVEYLDCCTVVD